MKKSKGNTMKRNKPTGGGPKFFPSLPAIILMMPFLINWTWLDENVVQKPAEFSIRHLWIKNVDSNFPADTDINEEYRFRKGFFYVADSDQLQSTLTTDIDITVPEVVGYQPGCHNPIIEYHEKTIEHHTDIDLSVFSFGVYPYDMEIEQLGLEVNPWIGLGYCKANNSDPFLSVEGGIDFEKRIWWGLHAIAGISYFMAKPEEYNFDSARAFLGLGWRF